MFPATAQTTTGPAPWPPLWGKERASAAEVLPLVGLALLAGILTLVVAAIAGTTGAAPAVAGFAAIGAILIPAIAQRTALLRRRRSALSPKITLADLDTSSGAITAPDTGSQPQDGLTRGVLIPLSRRGAVALLSQITTRCLYAAWLAVGGYLALGHHRDGTIDWTSSFVSYLLWLCAAVMAVIVVTPWIRCRLRPGRGLSQLVLTPAGLWINGSTEQLWLQWGAVTAVRPVGPKPRIAVDFSSGIQPVLRRTTGDWAHHRVGTANISPQLYALDAALLLVMLQQISGDPYLQRELATPAAISRLASTYANSQPRTTYPPSTWPPQ